MTMPGSRSFCGPIVRLSSAATAACQDSRLASTQPGESRRAEAVMADGKRRSRHLPPLLMPALGGRNERGRPGRVGEPNFRQLEPDRDLAQALGRRPKGRTNHVGSADP